MNLQEIEHAIAELNPQELVRFRQWLEKFERNTKSGTQDKLANREYIRSLRGKYKGKGLMKALIADKKLERDDMT
jgi:hypothetical protein